MNKRITYATKCEAWQKRNQNRSLKSPSTLPGTSPTSPESPDANSSTSRSPPQGLPLLEAKVPSQYASAVQSLLSTEQDSVATSAIRPGVSPPAGQTGGGVKPHPGPAPGVGLLLAGVFVEKMLRKKREVPPQAKESEEPSRGLFIRPRGRAEAGRRQPKSWRVRSRLCRRRSLQVNTHS